MLTGRSRREGGCAARAAVAENGETSGDSEEKTKISTWWCQCRGHPPSGFTAPNVVWVTDITEFKTGEGKLYVCLIKDVDDGALAAWKTSARATAPWGVSTVAWVVAVRRPEKDTIYGRQYTSKAYQQCLQTLGLRISMGRVRTGADNASAESLFAQLKREMVPRRRVDTRQEATAGINQYFLQVYNPWRQKYRQRRADS